jgi:hypothetical protein
LSELRIEVIDAGEGPLSGYVAELEGLQYRQKFCAAELPPDSVLRLRNVPYGDYKLTIVDGAGVLEHEQVITGR